MENSLFFLTVSRSISVNCLPSSAVVSATLWKAKFLWNTSILVGGTICDANCTRFPRSAGKKNPVRHVSCSSFAMLRFSVLSGLVEKLDLGNLIKSQLGKWPKGKQANLAKFSAPFPKMSYEIWFKRTFPVLFDPISSKSKYFSIVTVSHWMQSVIKCHITFR